MSDPYERAEQEKRRAQQPKQPEPQPKPTGYEQAEREKERAQTPRDSSGKFILTTKKTSKKSTSTSFQRAEEEKRRAQRTTRRKIDVITEAKVNEAIGKNREQAQKTLDPLNKQITDISSRSNMTVTSVAERSITYTIDPGGGAPLHTNVYWDAYGGPTQVTGADHMNYDESTGVATLTSTGAVTVTLFYADISHDMWDAGKSMANLFTLFAVICIFAIFDEARGGFENGKLIMYLIVMAVVMAVAAVISGWGY